MEYYNNILCVSCEELVGDVISRAMYVNMYNRNQLRVVRRACYNTPALVAYDSLPDRVKIAFTEKYGDPKQIAITNPLKARWVQDAKAMDFYATFKLPSGENLKDAKVKELTATASALNAIHELLNVRSAKRKALGGSTRNLMETVITSVKALQAEYGYNLPTSAKRLRLKLLDYKKNGYGSLISGKFGNENSAKVADDEQQATLRKMLRDHRNLDNAQISSLYNIVANNIGWKPITASTVMRRREEWDLITYNGRRGETAFNTNKAMQVKRRAPKHPMLYWTMDGWDVELLYQKTYIDDNGRTVTTYHNRLAVVVVLDACLKYPVGFAIGTHETPELIREAVRNAIDHTIDIFNARYKPLQLQTDHYGKGTLKPFYEAAAALYTPARVRNHKSKVIEPYFKRLNKKYCQLERNWSGFGVTAEKESQPNEEYLNKIRHSFPDKDECAKQIKRALLYERKEKYAEYKQLWEELPAENKLSFSDADYLYSLGEVKKDTNRLEAPGFIIQMNKVKYTYDSFDVAFRQNAHVDWVTRYMPGDMSKVLVSTADGSLRFVLTEKYVQPMALAERAPGDAAALQSVNEFNRNLKDTIIESMNADYETVTDLFNRHASLDNTLAKLVIVDSLGQHKDRKNEKKIAAAAKKLAEKQETKLIAQAEKSFADQQREYIENKVDFSQYI